MLAHHISTTYVHGHWYKCVTTQWYDSSMPVQSKIELVQVYERKYFAFASLFCDRQLITCHQQRKTRTGTTGILHNSSIVPARIWQSKQNKKVYKNIQPTAKQAMFKQSEVHDKGQHSGYVHSLLQ